MIRRHASRVHFAKIHFGKIHFGSKKLGDGGDLLGDGVNLLVAKVQKNKSAKIQISVKNSVWRPVEWVGDQLTGWGGSSQKPNSKIIFLRVFHSVSASELLQSVEMTLW